jgi:hypothetical protein
MADRHRDIARSVQAMYEEAFFHVITPLARSSGLDAIALAGGCAMNSVANGKIRRATPFRRVYVQAAAGDAGGAIGAAFALWHREGGARSFVMDHAYWGPQFAPNTVADLLAAQRGHIAAADCTIARLADEAELCRRTAAAVADGKVVGWFQGRMEWGPRALGNRSIVCDPRRADMKAILNAKIKRRESFRPFAPSVLEETVAEWFEEDDAVPFMMQVFQIRQEKRPLVPAVTHVDGRVGCRRSMPGRIPTITGSSQPSAISLRSPWCSTRPSTRTSRSSALRRRRWTASCAPAWMSSSSATSCCRARNRAGKRPRTRRRLPHKRAQAMDVTQYFARSSTTIGPSSTHRVLLLLSHGSSRRVLPPFGARQAAPVRQRWQRRRCAAIASQLTIRYRDDRLAIAAIALTTDSSALTACGNDLGVERILPAKSKRSRIMAMSPSPLARVPLAEGVAKRVAYFERLLSTQGLGSSIGSRVNDEEPSGVVQLSWDLSPRK